MQNKVCMITGATSGIGKATAMGLANIGANVVIISRDEEQGEKAQEVRGRLAPNLTCTRLFWPDDYSQFMLYSLEYSYFIDLLQPNAINGIRTQRSLG